jgi:hypothetical protein
MVRSADAQVELHANHQPPRLGWIKQQGRASKVKGDKLMLSALPEGWCVMLTADVVDPTTQEVMIEAPVMLSESYLRTLKDTHGIEHVFGFEYEDALSATVWVENKFYDDERVE